MYLLVHETDRRDFRVVSWEVHRGTRSYLVFDRYGVDCGKRDFRNRLDAIAVADRLQIEKTNLNVWLDSLERKARTR